MKNKITISTILLFAFSFIIQAQETDFDVSILAIPEGAVITDGMEIELTVFTSNGQELKECELFLNDISLGKKSQGPFIFKLKDIPRSTVYRIRAEAKSEVENLLSIINLSKTTSVVITT
jgi:hypothetical protein